MKLVALGILNSFPITETPTDTLKIYVTRQRLIDFCLKLPNGRTTKTLRFHCAGPKDASAVAPKLANCFKFGRLYLRAANQCPV